MNKTVKVIYKRLTKNFYKHGYINLNHRLVNTKDDLAEICSIFRNPEYETFRMIYMKEQNIVGYESISSKCPSQVPLFINGQKHNRNYEKCYYKIKERMNRLNADSYYMVHNHPTGITNASNSDINITKQFIERLKGFKGHLILGFDSYAWISKDDSKLKSVYVENFIPINFKKVDKMSQMMNKKSIYDIPIKSRKDLVAVMKNIIHTKDYSTAILTDRKNKIRMILDIPNTMLNQQVKNLNGYFKNLARKNGVDKIFFGTNDLESFNKSIPHLDFGTFKDSIYFKEVAKDTLSICEITDHIQERNLFDDEYVNSPYLSIANFNIHEDELRFQNERKINMNLNFDNDYIIIPSNDFEKEKFLSTEDTFEPNEHQIKILLKRVGKAPIVKVIENTLESKQALVGGLIEVVPYLDDTLLICNEEGKISNLEPNLIFDYDYIAGDCFIIGDDYENAGFKSLTSDEIKKSKIHLAKRSVIPQDTKSNNLRQSNKEYER